MTLGQPGHHALFPINAKLL